MESLTDDNNYYVYFGVRPVDGRTNLDIFILQRSPVFVSVSLQLGWGPSCYRHDATVQPIQFVSYLLVVTCVWLDVQKPKKKVFAQV